MTKVAEHPVVSHAQWLQARVALLDKEKELTRRRDELSRLRRELPWVKVEKPYTFKTPCGQASLADLFDGHSQLVTYHFMFGPDWTEGCPGCSFLMDNVDGTIPHLKARDVSLVMVSRAPLASLEAFKKRMGWRIPWVSSLENDFNTDFGVTFSKEQLATGRKQYNYGSIVPFGEETPGLSAFIKDEDGDIFHTYSTYGRGLEPILGTYAILDLAPKGRDEENLPTPNAWVRHHDKYEQPARGAASCCHQEKHA